MNSPTGRRATARCRAPRAILGTPTASPAARVPAAPPRSPAAWCRWRWVPIPVGRSVFRRRCAAVGFKPSFASVPLDGVFPLASSLDHVGPIANHVEDARLLFEVIAGRTCASLANPRPLRVGWITSGSFGPVDAELDSQVYQAAQQLFGEGLQELDELEQLSADMKATLQVLQRAEAFNVHAERMQSAPHTFEDEVRERLELSCEVRGWQYIRAQSSQAR